MKMRLSLPPAAFLLLISSGSHHAFAFNINPDLPHGEKSELRPLGHTAQPGTWRASIPFDIPPPPPDEPFIPRGPPQEHMLLDPTGRMMMGPPPPMGYPPFLGPPVHPGMMGPPSAFLNEPLHPNAAPGGPQGGGFPLDGPPLPPPPGPIPGMMGPVYDEVIEHPMQGPGPGFWQHKFDNLKDAGPGNAPFQVPRDFIDNAPQSEQRPHRPMEEPKNNNSNGPSSWGNANPTRRENPSAQTPRGGGIADVRSSIDPNAMKSKMPRNDQQQVRGGNRPPSTGQGGLPSNQGMNNKKNPQMNRWPYNMQTPPVHQSSSNKKDPNAYVPMEDPNGTSGGRRKTGSSVGPSHHRQGQQSRHPYGNNVEPRYRNGGDPTVPMAGPNSNAGGNIGENFERPSRRPPPPPPVQYRKNGTGGDPNEHVPMADPNGSASSDNGRSLDGGIQNRNDFLPMERYDDYNDDRYNHRQYYHDDPMMMDEYERSMEAYRASEYDNFNLHPPMEEYDHFMYHFHTNEQPPLPPPPLPPADEEFYEGDPLLSQSPLPLPPRPPASHFERGQEWYGGYNGPNDPRMRLDDMDGYLDYF